MPEHIVHATNTWQSNYSQVNRDIISSGCGLVLKQFNHLSAIFSEGTKAYLHFMSVRHTDMIQIVENLPQVRQELTYSA